ncbi:MAG: Gfo/Idh/MocA family oxidoreductase, partial [Chitinophagaceae bacterium]
MSEKNIRFAVVGCGHIGKRHAEMILRNNESELSALIDVKDPSVLGIGEYDVPFFHSLDAFFASGVDVDVVNIATPNGYHAEQALQALDQKKHVVIEKPMTLRRTDAEKVIYKALNVHRHVFAVMQN